jgi:hypothetical protein
MNTENPSFGIGSSSVMLIVGELWVCSAADEPAEPAPWPARGPFLDNTAMASGSLF